MKLKLTKKLRAENPYRDVRVSGVSLGIRGREDSVDKNKGANDLSTKAIALGVAMAHKVGSTTIGLVQVLLEALHHTSSTDGPKALHDDVEQSSCEGELPCQKESEGHSWVDVSTCCKKHKYLNFFSIVAFSQEEIHSSVNKSQINPKYLTETEKRTMETEIGLEKPCFFDAMLNLYFNRTQIKEEQEKTIKMRERGGKANLKYRQCSRQEQRSYHQKPKQFLGYPQKHTSCQSASHPSQSRW